MCVTVTAVLMMCTYSKLRSCKCVKGCLDRWDCVFTIPWAKLSPTELGLGSTFTACRMDGPSYRK